MTKTIICTGFHRSGTSLAGQILYLAKIPMALNMLQGNIANPDGYFEDLVAIHMHDRFLSNAGTSWKYHNEIELQQDSTMISRELKDYIEKRDNVSTDLWAVKDPRASLFLPAWKNALAGNGCYVLMYRHWSLCFQSMFKRHSRWIAHKLLSGEELEKHIVFWQQPELIAQMWLTYNKALIQFIKTNPKITLLVPQQALLEGFNLIDAINSKFNLQLEQPAESPVKREYTLEYVESLTIEHLSSELFNELNDVYKQLSELTNAPFAELKPKIRKVNIDKMRTKYLLDKLESSPYSSQKNSTKNEKMDNSLQLSYLLEHYKRLSYNELINHLNFFSNCLNSETFEQLLPVGIWLFDKDDTNWRSNEWLGRIYGKLDKFKQSEFYFQKAIQIKGCPLSVSILLADTYLNQGKFKSAEYFYNLAKQAQTTNPKLSQSLSLLFKLQGKYKEALIESEIALSIDEGNQNYQLELIDIYENLGETDNARKKARYFFEKYRYEKIGIKYSSLMFDLSPRKNQNGYIKNIEKTLSIENVNNWSVEQKDFYQKLPLIDSFIMNILCHWSSVTCLREESLIYLGSFKE